MAGDDALVVLHGQRMKRHNPRHDRGRKGTGEAAPLCTHACTGMARWEGLWEKWPTDERQFPEYVAFTCGYNRGQWRARGGRAHHNE